MTCKSVFLASSRYLLKTIRVNFIRGNRCIAEILYSKIIAFLCSLFKFGSSSSKKVIFVYLNERPLKIDKKLSISCLKTLFILKWNALFLTFFYHAEKRLHIKVKISLPALFSAWFLGKYSSRYILFSDQVLFSDYLYFWDIGQYVYCSYLLSSLWRQKCWNYP